MVRELIRTCSMKWLCKGGLALLLCICIIGYFWSLRWTQTHEEGISSGEPALILRDLAASINLYNGPRNLTNPSTSDYSQSGQSKIIDRLLRQKTGGFFVEVGAHDGEDLSNTLFFEKERNWTGLLIEPNPKDYQELLYKKRNVFSIQSCLSTASVTGEVNFSPEPELGRILSDRALIETNPAKIIRVPCYPLHLILKTLGVRLVDFFSLDVEGHEMEILESFPFEEITFGVICVEFNHVPGDGPKRLTSLLTSKGYRLVETKLEVDLVFIHPGYL